MSHQETLESISLRFRQWVTGMSIPAAPLRSMESQEPTAANAAAVMQLVSQLTGGFRSAV